MAAAATVGTAIFAYIRRPKSSPTEVGPYFTEAALLSPPLTRPAYSDRMAYVLAEMSDLAYYQFEGQRGFVDDAVENAKSLDLTDDTNVREFLEKFSTELMSGRRLQLGSMKKVLSNSGFSLLDVIDINETQGFACKRIAENEPPYLVLAFRGWLASESLRSALRLLVSTPDGRTSGVRRTLRDEGRSGAASGRAREQREPRKRRRDASSRRPKGRGCPFGGRETTVEQETGWPAKVRSSVRRRPGVA